MRTLRSSPGRAPLSCLFAVLVLVAGTVSSAHGAAARQATDQSVGVGPRVGERIRIADDAGKEAAAIAVARLEDPYELELAEPGYRYVLAEVVVEYTGADVIDTQSTQFTILDTAGFVYDPDDTFLHRLDGPEDGGARPGQAWGTELLFQVPLDAVLAQIRFGLTPLVDLRTARVAHGDVVPIVGPDRAPLATVTVGPAIDPYDVPVEVTHIVLEEERYVVFPVEVAAIGERPFALDPGDFWVLDNRGIQTREKPRGEYQNDPDGPYLQPDDSLEPGETASGLIKFILPDGATPVKVIYSPITDEFDQFVILAETDEPPPVATSSPIWVATPDVVTAGCEGVVEWAEDLTARFVRLSEGMDTSILDDPASADPAALRQAAAVYDALATDLSAINPPPPAAAVHTAMTTISAEFAGGLETIAAAVESGDQAEIDAAVAAFAEIALVSDAAFADLEAACPEVVDLL